MILKTQIDYCLELKERPNSEATVNKFLKKLWMWSNLLRNDANLDTNGYFRRIWQALSQYCYPEAQEIVKKFEKRKAERAELNEQKLKVLKWSVQDFEPL